ncbi:MAG: hypothetical protein SGI74_04145 [Oligoflexia bacterium]|nr:hypothetical protein [Oligoflexia bacterium]
MGIGSKPAFKRIALTALFVLIGFTLIFSYQNFATVNPQICNSHDINTNWEEVDRFSYTKTFNDGGITAAGHIDSLQISDSNNLLGQEIVTVVGHGDSGILSGSSTASRTKRLFVRRIPINGTPVASKVQNLLDSDNHFFQASKVDFNGNVFATGFSSSGLWRSRVLFSNPSDITKSNWFENPNITVTGIEPSDSRFSKSTFFDQGRDGDIFMAIRSQTSAPQVVSLFRRDNGNGSWTSLASHDFGIAIEVNLFFRDNNKFLYVFVTDKTSVEIARAFRVDTTTFLNATKVTLGDLNTAGSFNFLANQKKFKMIDGFYDEKRDRVFLVGQTVDATGLASAAIVTTTSDIRSPPSTQTWTSISKPLSIGKTSRFTRVGIDRDGNIFAFGNGLDANNSERKFIVSSSDGGTTWSAPSANCDGTGFCTSISVGGSSRSVVVQGSSGIWSNGSAFSGVIADHTNDAIFKSFSEDLLSIVSDQGGRLWALTDSPSGAGDNTLKTLKVYKMSCSSTQGSAAWPSVNRPRVTIGVPAKPVLVFDDIAGQTNQQVQFKWSHVGGSLFYKVQRQRSSEFSFSEMPVAGSVSSPTIPIYAKLATPNVNEFIFTDTQLTNNEPYKYRVYGVSVDGDIGIISSPDLTLTPNIPTPLKPSITSNGESLAGNKILLTINRGDVFTTRFILQRRELPSTIFTTIAPNLTASGSSTAFEDSGLTTETTYAYRVTPFNNENENGPVSDERQDTPRFPPPPPVKPFTPASLTAAAQHTPFKVTLNWANGNGDATHDGFRITRSLDGGLNFIQIGGIVLPTTLTLTDDTGVTGGQTPQYKVTSRFAANTSKPESDPATASIAVPTPTPVPPSNVRVTQSTMTLTRVAWDASPLTQAYGVFRSKDGSLKNRVQVFTSTPLSLEFPDTDVTAGSTYAYCIKSYLNFGTDSELESACSAPDVAITAPTPAPTPNQGSCIIASEDISANLPMGFFAPSAGQGYQKSNITTGVLADLEQFCAQGPFDSLMTDYCRLNTKQAQACVAVYLPNGNQSGTTCKTIVADILQASKRQCPKSAGSVISKGANADKFDPPKIKKNVINSNPTCGMISTNSDGPTSNGGMGAVATAFAFLMIPAFTTLSLRRKEREGGLL